MTQLKAQSVRELILKVTTVKQLSTLFLAISQSSGSFSFNSSLFVVIRSAIEVLPFCSCDL